MKFNKHIKRAEGQKPPKVELTISADGLTIQDPKSKMILHQYPLHRISYCADDKSDKKMFTFIAKAATTNDHYCYVFDSDKCAEEITLTVGQAFDLAYKRFLESGTPSGDDVDYKKQYLVLQRRVQSLQFENDALRKRVAELEKLKDRSDLEEYMKNNQLHSLTSITLNLRDSSTDDDDNQSSTDDYEPPQPKQSAVGRRLEGLLLDSDMTHTNGTTGNTPQSPTPLLSPPPPSTRSHRQQLQTGLTSPTQMTSPTTIGQPVRQQSGDFGSRNPFSSPVVTSTKDAADPFGMGAFNPTSKNNDAAFGGSSEQELMDIQAGFSRGLSFGTDDFNLDDLDPLNQRL
nr:hypothetical protein BaRGS_030425 [Batillaria attramentaria]